MRMIQNKFDQEHYDDFLKTFASTLLAWQFVENNLFLVFNFLVGHKKPAVLSAVYHSISSLKLRLDIVDAAAAVVLEDTPYLKEWKKLPERIRRNSKKRNYLAHFTLVSHTDGKGETKVLLKPSIFRINVSVEHDNGYDTRQLNEWRKSFDSLADDLRKFLDNLPRALKSSR